MSLFVIPHIPVALYHSVALQNTSTRHTNRIFKFRRHHTIYPTLIFSIKQGHILLLRVKHHFPLTFLLTPKWRLCASKLKTGDRDQNNSNWGTGSNAQLHTNLLMVHQRVRCVKTPQTAKKAPTISTRAAEILKELEVLQWHKIENEAALKAALIKSNQSKQQELTESILSTERKARERKLRMEAIIEEERMKPLHLKPSDLEQIEKKERTDTLQLESDIERHVVQLRRLRQKFEERQSLHARTRRYQQQYKKLSGRTETKIDRMPSSERAPTTEIDPKIGIIGKSAENALKSLDTLIDLETRIARLENGNPSFPTKNPFVSSQRAQSSTPKRKQNRNEPVRRSKFHTTTRTSYSIPSTFLTAIPDQKMRQIRRMNDRQRREYLKRDKIVVTQQHARKQDVVIAQWLEQKRKAAVIRKRISTATRSQHRTPRTQPPKVMAPLVGASSGRRVTNVYMQRFERMKREIQQRKEAVRPPPIPPSPSISHVSFRPFTRPHTRPKPIDANPSIRTTTFHATPLVPSHRYKQTKPRLPPLDLGISAAAR